MGYFLRLLQLLSTCVAFSLVAGVMLECVYEALLNSPIQLSH